MIQEEINHKPKRRWFQFRLRTLLVLTALIALLMPWSVPYANQWIAYYKMMAEERERVRGYQRVIDLLWDEGMSHAPEPDPGPLVYWATEEAWEKHWKELKMRRKKYTSIQPNDESSRVASP